MIPKRFWDKVNVTGRNECWHWTGGRGTVGKVTTSTGHGIFSFDGKSINAHRFLMQKISGRELREDEYVCHTCDTYGCCNPRHLYIGDAKTNQLDSLERTGRNGLIYRTHRNCNDRINNIEEAVEMFNNGVNVDYICFKLGVDKSIF